MTFNPDCDEAQRRRAEGATHPADHIREYLAERNWKQADLARATGLGTGRVSEILSGKRKVTLHIALRLEKALGLKAYIWVGLQTNWDLREAKRGK